MSIRNIKTRLLFPLMIVMTGFFSSCSEILVETNDNFEAVNLPDGSQIYLNRGTSVEYDEDFKTRVIDLEGEAFFSVAPGESPFIVKTSKGEVTAVGTEFNVKSEAKELEVEVEEGLVNLKTKHDNSQLKEGEMAVYNESKDAIQKGKSEFKGSVWLQEMKIAFKKMGREFKLGSKQLGKEFHKGGKKIGTEVKKTGKELKEILK